MAVNHDFRDLFSALNVHDVRYLVVGGYAVTFHSRPRFTKDLDVWIDSELKNAERAWHALAAFGAPMNQVRPSDLASPGVVFQIGIAPNRIDILTRLEGLVFADAWPRRVATSYGDCLVSMIGRLDLIRNKRALGRPQDLLDAEALEADPIDPSAPG